jgi:hypothetical protein
VSDPTTSVIARDQLDELIHAAAQPAASAHTIPRVVLEQRGRIGPAPIEDEEVVPSVSPLAVLCVIAMLVVLFVEIVRA